jgi:NAD-dependent dihydropyrimidine dehydrogenase PreA subunit/uncharacterized membrane protein YgcG
MRLYAPARGRNCSQFFTCLGGASPVSQLILRMARYDRPRLRQRSPGARHGRSGPPPREERRTTAKKALVNYWVDMVTGAAFLLCALTGIVLFFPGVVHVAAGAAPTIMLLPATWWHKVHDWTGVAMVAGTALHLVLHAKWLTHMTRRVFGSPEYRPDADAAAEASLQRLEDLRAERQREQRISRRRFLAGAAAVGTGVLLASVGLMGKDAVSSAATRLRDDGWTGGAQDQSGAASSGGGASNGSSSAGSGSSSQSAASGGVGTTQVVVDQSACIACGRCLEVCPAGVFDWSGSGRAEAVNADACIRCGRCLQACPAGAITVTA